MCPSASARASTHSRHFRRLRHGKCCHRCRLAPITRIPINDCSLVWCGSAVGRMPVSTQRRRGYNRHWRTRGTHEGGARISWDAKNPWPTPEVADLTRPPVTLQQAQRQPPAVPSDCEDNRGPNNQTNEVSGVRGPRQLYLWMVAGSSSHSASTTPSRQTSSTPPLTCRNRASGRPGRACRPWPGPS